MLNPFRLIALPVALLTVACLAFAEEPQTTLVLPPTTDNPRNSEGDFIRLADGRLLLIYTHFTGGTSDHAKAHLASRVSQDKGATWSDESQLVIDTEGGMNVMSVSLLRLAGEEGKPGPIALFYLRKTSTSDCRPIMRLSHDEAKTWGEPTEVISDSENGYYVLNNDRAIQLASGRLVLPVAQHVGPGMEKWTPAATILCYTSDDLGETWERSNLVPAPKPIDGKQVTTQEPGLVELADGRLMIFCRTSGGSQFLAYSQDEGTTWSQLGPSGIISPLSPATIERIPGSNALVMAWNNHENIPSELKGKRTPLSIAISIDNGQTWQNTKVIEDNPTGWFCYIALDFVDDHLLLAYCSGDRSKMNGLAQTSVTRISRDWVTGKGQGK